MLQRKYGNKNITTTVAEQKQHKVSLKSLQVRLIKLQERETWDALMAKHHYLGFNGIVGETLPYVAELDGKWVVLVGSGSAVFKCSSRDRWIGWNQHLQWSRLKLIANNVRFLILPDSHLPNLGSRVLALNLKRLSKDSSIATVIQFCLQKRFWTAAVSAAVATRRRDGLHWGQLVDLAAVLASTTSTVSRKPSSFGRCSRMRNRCFQILLQMNNY